MADTKNSISAREHDEIFAIKCLRLGNGMKKVDHSRYDQVYLAWWLEDYSRVNVYLMKDGETKETFQFEIKQVPEEKQEKYDNLRVRRTPEGAIVEELDEEEE